MAAIADPPNPSKQQLRRKFAQVFNESIPYITSLDDTLRSAPVLKPEKRRYK